MRNRTRNRLLLSVGCVVCLLHAGRVPAADDEWQGQMVVLVPNGLVFRGQFFSRESDEGNHLRMG